MNRDVIISCAVTGSGDTVNKHPNIPVTPEQIANAAIEAASAGAAIAHIHVRDLNTGKGSRDDELYKEVVSRIKDSGTNVIINLTSGMGGDIEIGPEDDLLKFGPNTDFVNAIERLSHVEEILPDICSLDCGTLNFGDGNMIYVSTPEQLRIGAKRIQELGVKPELEVFEKLINAFLAAFTAIFTSSSLPNMTSPITSSVAGFTTGIFLLDCGATH